MWSVRGCPDGSCICFRSRMPSPCCRDYHMLLAGGGRCSNRAACQAAQQHVWRALQQPCRQQHTHRLRRTYAAAAAGGGKEATLQEVAAIDQLVDLLLVRRGLCQATMVVASAGAARLANSQSHASAKASHLCSFGVAPGACKQGARLVRLLLNCFVLCREPSRSRSLQSWLPRTCWHSTASSGCAWRRVRTRLRAEMTRSG